MNTKRWLLASLAGFVVYTLLEMVIHGMLLEDLYVQTAGLWRPMVEMEALMWLLFLMYAIAALLLAFIYTKGHEPDKNGLAQGARFGFYMGLLLGTLMSVGSYFALPMPAVMAASWLIATVVTTTAAGAVIGLVYRR